MTTTINNEHKELNFSSEREQSQACLNSAEHEKNQGRKVLNVPNLRFPEFEGEWEKQKLCDISSIVGRIGFRGYTTNDIVEKGMGAIALSPTNIVNNQLTYDKDNTYISMSKYEESPEIMIKRGDVIFVKTGSTVGKVAYVDKMICKTTLNPQVVVLKDIKCDNYILSVIMSTRKFQNKIQRITVGGAVPTLSQMAMGNIFVSLPAAKEQEKISKFISLIDERIVTQNKIIDKLQSLIKGISNKLLNSKDGMLVRLGAILKERSEKTKKNNQYAVLSSTVNGLFSQRDYFSKDIASENNVGYKIIRLHDVVLSPQNLWMGNINYNDKFDIGIVSPSYKVFLISDDYDKRYVTEMLKTHRALYDYQLISEQGASVVRRNLNLESFGQLVFRIPPLDKQREIGKTISLLKSRLETESMLKATYQSQKQYLLRQMFI